MMYVHVWNKYLPIIKILMKKSAAGNQTLDLNRIDFERAGSGRKAGYKFLIEMVQGRVANVISGSPLASDLAMVLLQDSASRTILASNDINLSLNTKFQLAIVNKNLATEVPPAAESKEEQPAEKEGQPSETENQN
jgi:hypothetical protein